MERSISISSSLSITSFADANASSNPVAASKTPLATIASTDTVELTESQQVHQLYHQGQGVSQIASGLSLCRCCE